MAKEKKKEEAKESIHVIDLGGAYKAPSSKRNRRAVTLLKGYLMKHTRKSNIKIADPLNNVLCKRGVGKPPRRIKIKARVEEDTVTADVA